MDELGPIELEFIINNPELATAAATAEATMQGVTDAMTARAAKASAAVDLMMAHTIEGLKVQAAQYEALKSLTPDESKIASYNQRIEQTTAEITRLSALGKSGFDELGNAIPVEPVNKFSAAISRATDLSTIGGRVVQMFSRQIIGLGVAFLGMEIGAKAIKSLVEYISQLNIFNPIAKEAELRSKAFSDAFATADYSKAIESITQLKVNLDLANAGFIDKDKVIDEYNNSLGKVAGKVDTLDEAEKGLAKNANNFIRMTLLKAAAQIVLADAAKDQADTAIKNQKLQDDIANTKTATLYGVGMSSPDLMENEKKARIANYQKEIDDNTARLKLGYDRRLSIITNFDTEQASLSKGMGQIPGDGGSSGSDVTAIATLRNQLANDALERKKIQSQTLISDDKQSYATRLAAIASFYSASKEIASNNEKLALSDKKLSADQKLHIENEYGNTVLSLQKSRNDQVKSLKDSPEVSVGESLLASQKSIQEKIAALKDKYQSKDKTRDEQQLDAIKTNFAAINAAIDAENTKLQNAIKDKKITQAAADKLGLKVQPKLTPDDLNAALDGEKGTQAFEQTKNEINQQKALFTEYEAFKLKAGTDAANKLYGNQLQAFKTYLDYLKSLQPTEALLGSSDAKTRGWSSALSDYLKTAIPAAQTQELEQQVKHLQGMIFQDQSYQEKRITIITKANADFNQLAAAGYGQQAAQVAQNTQKELTALDVEAFEKQGRYKQLFENIDKLSSDSALSMIADAEAQAKAEFISGAMTAEAYQKVIDALAKLQQAIADKNAAIIGDVGASLSKIGKGFTDINSGVGSFISGLGQMATGLAGVMKQMAQLQSDKDNGLNTTGDYIGLATTAASSLETIISGITSAYAANKQAALDYYNSVIAFQNAYNDALIQQQLIQYKTDGNLFIANYSEQFADAAKAYNQATTALQGAEAALAKGQAIVGTKKVVNGTAVLEDAGAGAIIGAEVGGWIGAAVGAAAGALIGIFAQKKTVNVLAPLLQTFPQLIDQSGKFNATLAQQLIATNKVTDATKVLLQNAINYYNTQTAAIDQITQALTTLAGNLGTSLDNALVTAFENGTSAADAFGKAVSDVIGNIVQQFLFENIFGDKFNTLNNELKATVLAGGGQAAITADFVDFFKTAGPLVQTFNSELTAAQQAAAAAGINILGPTSSTSTGVSSTTLTGQVGGMTANEANALEGAINGLRLTNLLTNDILTANSKTMGDQLSEMRSQTLIQMQIAANTLRSANNSDTMVSSLKNIDGNTSSSSLTNVLRAAGKV